MSHLNITDNYLSPALFYAEMGDSFLAQGRLDDALTAFDQALIMQPKFVEAHCQRGTTLLASGKLEQALAAYNEASFLEPDFFEAHINRGVALEALYRMDEALLAYEHAAHLAPDNAIVHHNRGNVLTALDRTDDALAAYDRALRIDPNLVVAHNNRGCSLMALGLLEDAHKTFDQAIHIKPDFADAYVNKGKVLGAKGRFEQAIAAYRKAIELQPTHGSAWTNLLWCLNYIPGVDGARFLAEHKAWATQLDIKAVAPSKPHMNCPNPQRTLRIGYVSADFGQHPVGFLFLPLLAAHDQEHFEAYCYSNRFKEDSITARIKALATVWRRTIGVSDEALAEQIRADGIDILVDLSGHTGGNRLTMFALKPAPIQAHWAGYSHTTALPAMDYALWDAVQVPECEERWFTENIIRLPDAQWCYAPPDYAPEVSAPPVLSRGYITFGSFNNLTKINSNVIELWARILNEVPDSRLMLNWKTLADPRECEQLEASFSEHGIAPSRLILTRGDPTHAGVLAEYGEIDIALDPFPFSGGGTTCEALWMGVPMITLPETRPVSRQTQSLLTVFKRTEWIAKDPQDYVRIAKDLAADPDRLAQLRRSQRSRMAASPLCDGPRFARNFEAILRRMWRSWCDRQKM